MWFPSHRPVISGHIQILLLLSPWLLGLTYDPSAPKPWTLPWRKHSYPSQHLPDMAWTTVDVVKKRSTSLCSFCSSPSIFAVHFASGDATHSPWGRGGSCDSSVGMGEAKLWIKVGKAGIPALAFFPPGYGVDRKPSSLSYRDFHHLWRNVIWR